MGCEEDQVTIRPGRNIWVLARTDRDAAGLDDVLMTTGAVLKRFLGRASPAGTRSIFEVLQSPKDPDPHDARFVIGAARPVLVRAAQADSPETAIEQQPRIPANQRTDYFAECPTPRTIVAQRPWFVTAEFDWRAGATTIDWPRRAVNFLGMPVPQVFETDHANDWLLLAAGHQGNARESDTDLLNEVSDETAEAIVAAGKKVASVARPVLIGLALTAGVGGITYLVYRFGRPRRSEDP